VGHKNVVTVKPGKNSAVTIKMWPPEEPHPVPPLIFKVTFYSDDEIYYEDHVTEGGTVDVPQAPTKPGYTFSGWYDETNVQWNFATDIVKSDITLYAKWIDMEPPPVPPLIFKVTFYSDGEKYAEYDQVKEGGTVREPAEPTKPGYTFGGWYKDVALNNEWNFDTDTVISNTTLYAKWIDITIYLIDGEVRTPCKSLADALYIGRDERGLEIFTVSIYDGMHYLYSNYFGATIEGKVTIVNRGIDTAEIQLGDPDDYGNEILDYIFSVRNDGELTLQGKMTLKGIKDNIFALIEVGYGTFNMGVNVSIIGNINNNNDLAGGGVYVSAYGTFNMTGGTIRDNTAKLGGGVYVEAGGIFNMIEGTITGNTADKGGGVCVDGGTFSMLDGIITNNTAKEEGGGVYVGGRWDDSGNHIYGTFKMGDDINGGNIKIFNNDSSFDVYEDSFGNFYQNKGYVQNIRRKT
jgi:uncharacterized repeat protein (TIGR02543 family)